MALSLAGVAGAALFVTPPHSHHPAPRGGLSALALSREVPSNDGRRQREDAGVGAADASSAIGAQEPADAAGVVTPGTVSTSAPEPPPIAQPESPASDGPDTSAYPPDQGACPDGMVEVEGDYYATVGHVCRERLDGEVDRCGEYAPRALSEGHVDRKRFCVDRFEYPNLEGVRPVVMVSWMEAKSACEAEGKRLCTASEWTLACEGIERLPYPYGYRRDSTACNIDRPHPTPNENALASPERVSSEVARLDQRVASGEMARCRSPYGVRDMTGNVDEWVVNENHFGPAPADGSERPFISALKGGYWGPVRNRCRATTTAHNEWFRYYQVGFRCCADPP